MPRKGPPSLDFLLLLLLPFRHFYSAETGHLEFDDSHALRLSSQTTSGKSDWTSRRLEARQSVQNEVLLVVANRSGVRKNGQG